MKFKEFIFFSIKQLFLLNIYLLIIQVKCSKMFETYLKENRPNISFQDSYAEIDVDAGHCLRYQCNYYCFNGTSARFSENLNEIYLTECPFINELHFFNYTFLSKLLPASWPGPFFNRVKKLFIYASDVEYIENSAFQSQNLRSVHLQDLKLKYINKDIFANVSEQFTSFTLIQSDPELRIDKDSFFENVKYQIKKLTMQIGLWNVENITGYQCLFNNLEVLELNFNSFEGRLTAGSFEPFSVVQTLNLSNSRIIFLPENIFSSITRTLKILDLSNNNLADISSNIFGWRTVAKSLVIYLYQNPWECSCVLRNEISKLILGFPTQEIYCRNIENVLVTSNKICTEPVPSSSMPSTLTTMFEKDLTIEISSTQAPDTIYTETAQKTKLPAYSPAISSNVIPTSHELECHKDYEKQETDKFSIYWPSSQFDIVKKINRLEVDIVVKTNSSDTFGVLWFSKVSLQYYKMETNHNEYGLGCYGHMERITTVNHLLPEMSYTFCLILKDYLTVSPFSCKSVYIDANVDMNYSAWLTTNMKATGISVITIGIVLFMLFGILSVFVLLKHKPSLLKGSKRVAKQTKDTSNIIVFPEDKTFQKFKLMEEKMAINKPPGFPFKRLSVSTNSLESIQSYMNPENLNIYEIIPAHQSNSNLKCTEVTFKKKRSSNDPLPKIPQGIEACVDDEYYETDASVYI